MKWFKRLRTFMRLKDIIRKNGIKQSWVAERLNISPAYLSLILNGKRRLTEGLERDFDLLSDHIKGETR
tara:strand:- start:49 stop:255 length:207 start_codon:yes stop_codon:yes gene_type:complete